MKAKYEGYRRPNTRATEGQIQGPLWVGAGCLVIALVF